MPAYREQGRIGRALEDLRRHAPWAEVLVVDDGSPDQTAAEAAALGATVVSLPFNLGVGGAMQTGYLYAADNGYDVAVQFDGDGQHCAEEIERLIQPVLRGEADLVIGSRLLGEQSYHFPLARWLGSRLLVGMVRLLTGQKISDPTSGFRAASGRMIRFFSKFYPQTYLGDTVEALAMAAWHNMRLAQTPAKMRMSKTSSINNVRGMMHMLRIAVALVIDRMEKPFPFDDEDDASRRTQRAQ